MTPARLRTISHVVVREGGSDRADWRARGVCVTWTAWPWDPWYPDEGATSTDPVKRAAAWAKGRELCAGCPIRRMCLEDALDHESGSSYYRHGMRGGLDDTERANLARKRQRKAKREAMTSAEHAAIANAAWVIAAEERSRDHVARVARLTAQGQSAAEIAHTLGISTRQVVRYRAREATHR